ncbi:hypothetical protein FQN52_004696 [Onygenales sp. PD_12]|nr:hypothetical protein FQN52_004696 [Onygenales sp. PD_12]
MSVPLLSTAPESQFSDIEQPSQFNIVTFIEDKGIFEMQCLQLSQLQPQNAEELVEQLAEQVEQVESQFFIQDDEYEEDIDEDVGDSVDFNELLAQAISLVVALLQCLSLLQICLPLQRLQCLRI